MFTSETVECMEAAVTALAKNERDQPEAGLATSAAETGHALKDARKVLENLKEARTALTLPVYKSPRSEADLTEEERMALAGNDPVAGTEYRKWPPSSSRCTNSCATSPRPSACAPCASRRPAKVPTTGPRTRPSGGPPEWTEEAVRLMNARSQSLHDNTCALTRPPRW